MEVVSGVGVNAITGLVVWTAADLLDRYNKKKLNKRRLGHWHKLIFEESRITDIRTSKKAKIPVIPGSDELKKIASNGAKANIELGAVCWRGLMGMYANEEDIISHFKQKDCFRPYREVGAYRENIAAVINVKDLYAYIFKNLSPSSWARVTLNKQERVSTNIGEFSMLYFRNMKWFHFVPIASVTRLDAYENEFNRLRSTGHSIAGIEGSELMNIVFKSGTSKPWRFGLPGGIPDCPTKAIQKYVNDRSGPLAGGAVLPEREEDIVSYYSNFMSMAVWQAARRYAPDKFGTITRFHHIYEAAGLNEGVVEWLDKLEHATWAATRVKDLIPAAEAAVKLLVLIGKKCEEDEVKDHSLELTIYCTTAAKVFGGLVDRIFALGWTNEDWNALDQLAWLAGIEDGAEGEDIEENDLETLEFPDSSDESGGSDE